MVLLSPDYAVSQPATQLADVIEDGLTAVVSVYDKAVGCKRHDHDVVTVGESERGLFRLALGNPKEPRRFDLSKLVALVEPHDEKKNAPIVHFFFWKKKN